MNFSEKQLFVFFLSRVSLFEKYSHILIFYYFSSVRSFVTNAANAQSLTWWASSSRVDFHIHYMTSRDRLVWLRHSLHLLFSLLQFTHTHTQTLSHTHTHTLTHTPIHTLTYTISIILSISFLLTLYTHTHNLSLSLSLSLLIHSFSLSFSLISSLTWQSHILFGWVHCSTRRPVKSAN